MKKIIAVIFVACLGWAVWPYYALYDLATALEKNDPISMEHRVEWGQVRQGLRDDLKAMLMDKIRSDASAKAGDAGGLLGSSLALIAGPAIIDGLIEAYVTPPSIANMIRSGKLDKPTASAQNSEENGSQETEQKHGLSWRALKYAFFSGGPFSFRVEVINKAVEHPVVLLFKWAGDWKLARIFFLPASLPPANLESTVLKSSKQSVTESPSADVPMTDLLKPGPLGDQSIGVADAPLTIIEYASMTSPHSAHFHESTYPQLKKKYIDTGKVRLIFREFPLDPLAAAGSMLWISISR